MSALTIESMTWDEKLRVMEELWKSLSREEARLAPLLISIGGSKRWGSNL
jgi:hypothetical protein